MAYLEVSHSQMSVLKRTGGYACLRYIDKAHFLMLAWGPHHFRFDLSPFSPGVYTQSGGGGGILYRLASFHLKHEEARTATGTEWSYFYADYQGGGVWQPNWAYLKTENANKKYVPRATPGEDDSELGYRMSHDMLAELTSVMGSTQSLANGPVKKP